MSEHVLVTGGAGCIGSELAAQLLERGHRVTVIDDLSSGKLEHVEPFLENPSFHFLRGDLLDRAVVKAGMAGVGMVYHLAANPDVKFDLTSPTDKDLKQNVLATHLLLDVMKEQGVKRLAFSSTSAVYGLSPVQPIPESASFLRPISLYGATKLSCEAMISAFSHLFGMRCWIFRFSNIVGKKVRARGRTVISDFIHRLLENPRHLRILGDGRQAKSYLVADECVEAMLHVVERAQEPLNIHNLGCRDATTVRRIAAMVVEAMGLRDVEFSFTGTEGGWPGDVPRFILDVGEVAKLGWRARRTSEQAVAFAIESVLEGMREPACKP
jgi:UDP-glucose 4-epimerase